MILGIEHIALSTDNIDEAVTGLSNWGYISRFINKRLANASVKRPYLKNKSDFHDISYCQPKLPGLPIELIANGGDFRDSVERSYRPYKAIISGKKPTGVPVDPTPRQRESTMILSEIFGTKEEDVEPLHFPKFLTNCYHLNDPKNKEISLVKGVLIETNDIEGSINFWAKFDFLVNPIKERPGTETRWSNLTFKNNLFPMGLELILVQRGMGEKVDLRPYYLDSPGFTCLAFLTNNLESQSKFLKKNGIETTEPFSFEVGGNSLKINLCKNPEGGFVELIQFVKRISDG